MTLDRVSVVVTTRNEARNIGNCLESVKAQGYPAELVEIIVVDNASTDDTQAIARRYTDKVFDKGPERSAQRNFGFAQATGDVLVFLDADMILSASVLERSVAMLRQGYDALYIPEIVLGRGFFPTVRRFERSFYDATVIDCVRAFTRRAFDQAGGFDESLTGPEDWDFDKRMRASARVGLLSTYDFDRVDAYVRSLPGTPRAGAGLGPETPRAGAAKAPAQDSGPELAARLAGYEALSRDDRPLLFHNEAAFDLWRYLTKKTYYGGSFEAYIAKWPAGDADIRRQFGAFYRFFGVFLENGRWRRLLSHPRLTFGMYFLRFLVGLSYLLDKLKR
ncbi:GalNAc(5)-diNAcBac-PP-undecaprenol beta-1,3-glucosyltransferase [Fundidesulfovibrio magnetotacticus]|uniref:GalNAc(5)-diNAcBac-PP-undecaprenol beta-1,3-glucosyltransferase n=1 Tax=Fundidesulfovibrio magnetotacticus TaxID=2730080 RepID=A0A6V8LYW3_9BACT|nr:glycosyltransferase [Fundidesulfovibrio magnetotacticus]GFK95980.1 GalNAc(5)-diNAcBac-PP-undecaprenol beta-1,3-glucosyltransferase [Fundidesulfovibrio magnetotacticus]